MVSGDSATPRSSTPMLSRNRPTTLSSLVVRFEKLIAPVRSARSRNVAVAVWPGRMVPSSTVCCDSSSRRAPEIEFLFSAIWTRLAGVIPVLRIVTLASYGSPVRTVRGWEKAMENRGLRTNTEPAALPLTLTVPAASPSSSATRSRSMTCNPSCKPSTRNSAWPDSPGNNRGMSSAVPSSPSGPGRTIRCVGWMILSGPTRANRSGSSPG